MCSLSIPGALVLITAGTGVTGRVLQRASENPGGFMSRLFWELSHIIQKPMLYYACVGAEDPDKSEFCEVNVCIYLRSLLSEEHC